MNLEHNINGRWNEFRGAVQENWERLTESELDELNGQMEQLVDMVMKKYDLSQKNARIQVSKFWRKQLKRFDS